MFYSLEEAQEKLSLSAEQIKQLVQSGKLREFRDGAKVMFKIDEVDNFELDGADADIPLSPGDSAGKSGISLVDTGSSIGLMPGDSADQISLDDTSTAQDKDDTVITTHGTQAFDDSFDTSAELSDDELAQEPLSPDLADKVSLDSGGSGSGLLDLTREADDTSLGAELLEEIYPSAEEGAVETQLPTQMDIQATPETVEEIEEAQIPAAIEQPRMVQAYDQSSGAFGWMMIVPFVVLIYLACVATAALAEVQPAMLITLGNVNWYVMIGAAVLALIIWGFGMFLASQTATAGAPKAKKPKAKKVKVKKK